MGKSKLLLLVLVILLSGYAQASTVGVSPSIARFNKMIKGGYAEQVITTSTSIEAPVKAHITAEGDIKDWISLSPDEEGFVFSRAEPYSFSLIIEPPEDAQNGNYTGVLKITTDELATVERGAGSSVIAQVALLIYVEIVGDEIIACRAGAISTSSAEEGDPFKVRATVYNDGNVRFRPEFSVDVWDQYRTRVVFSKTFLGDQILPTKSKDLSKEVSNDLELGQYFAEVSIKECGVSKWSTFDILNEGEIADYGYLLGIRTNDVAYAGQVLPIAPIFKNEGGRRVLAQFKGEIRNLKTDEIETVLESDRLEVNPGESVEFRMFFTPEEKGDYLITGRVVYNNKITFEEQSRTVKVVQGSPIFRMGGTIYMMIYFIILLVILIMIGKIRKAKRR